MHVQHIFTTAALAGSALAGVLASISSTSTVTMYSPEPTQSFTIAAPASSCTSCAQPKDYDRNWEKDRVINDTRKHHQSFKLFAYSNDSSDAAARLPLHLQSQRRDMWTMKFGTTDDPDHNKDQPRWNLHDGSLQTDGSLPIKDTLFFRLYDGKFHKDTEFWTGTVYHDVSTRHPNKATYQKEGNAKLEARKGWSLVRDTLDPTAYVLTGSKPSGSFFLCPNLTHAVNTISPSDLNETDDDDDDDDEGINENHISRLNPYLVYSASNPRELSRVPDNFNAVKGNFGCTALVIKAENWTKPQTVD